MVWVGRHLKIHPMPPKPCPTWSGTLPGNEFSLYSGFFLPLFSYKTTTDLIEQLRGNNELLFCLLRSAAPCGSRQQHIPKSERCHPHKEFYHPPRVLEMSLLCPTGMQAGLCCLKEQSWNSVEIKEGLNLLLCQAQAPRLVGEQREQCIKTPPFCCWKEISTLYFKLLCRTHFYSSQVLDALENLLIQGNARECEPRCKPLS